ncbi:hypothetical protein ANCCAN_25787 [Ancylostoma caninum]|uniref:Tc1-like transposase DDE domain-containing protein n=1 Tax=Ancylostoma caninum TaxID=29170 RepID=A0A368FBT5_ANCCA|nr:hypothetical protein ANCCAN_25787 [Ancylostoma caninum]
MGPPLHARNKKPVKTVDWKRRNDWKEGKEHSISWKSYASVFRDAKRILLIDYLQEGKTVTGQYYASLLEKVKVAVEEKRPDMLKKKVLLLNDNATAHSSAVAQQILAEMKFKILLHPAYSPDLAP